MNKWGLAPFIHAYTARMAESLKGQLLIAAPVLLDPNFRRSVVLVIEHSEAGALGVVLNRPTELAVADAVPELAELDDGCIFAGGPVQPQAVIALAEYSGAPPEGAVCGPIAPVGIESDMDTLADRVHAGTRVRGYSGRVRANSTARLGRRPGSSSRRCPETCSAPTPNGSGTTCSSARAAPTGCSRACPKIRA